MIKLDGPSRERRRRRGERRQEEERSGEIYIDEEGALWHNVLRPQPRMGLKGLSVHT